MQHFPCYHWGNPRQTRQVGHPTAKTDNYTMNLMVNYSFELLPALWGFQQKAYTPWNSPTKDTASNVPKLPPSPHTRTDPDSHGHHSLELQGYCHGNQGQKLNVSNRGDNLENPQPHQISLLRPPPPWELPWLPPRWSRAGQTALHSPEQEALPMKGDFQPSALQTPWVSCRSNGRDTKDQAFVWGSVPWGVFLPRSLPDHPARPPGLALSRVGAKQVWPLPHAPALGTWYSSVNRFVCFIIRKKKIYFK